MHRSSRCKLEYFCFAQHLEATTKVTFLSVAVIIVVILIMHLWSQHGQNVEGMQVQSNDNIAEREQTEIDMSDTAFLLHLPPNQSLDLATGNHVAGLHIELMAEVQEPTSRVATGVLEVTSQPSLSPSPQEAVTVAGTENGVQDPELKTEFKVSCWLITISAGGIVSVLAGLPGNEKSVLTHKVLFKGYTYLTYASLILGVGLFLLTHIRPNIKGLVILVQFNMWMALGTITYAIGFATCILLPNSSVSLILVLVIPIVLVVLVVILIVRNLMK